MAESPAEDTITIVDDSGREKVERIIYAIEDVFGEKVYVTAEGLQYARDSLNRKRQISFLPKLDQIPQALSHPDIIIRDPATPEDTVIYYKRYYERRKRRHRLMAVIVKTLGTTKFLYNVHPQQSGKVKGCREVPKPEVLYLNPQRRRRDFGL